MRKLPRRLIIALLLITAGLGMTARAQATENNPGAWAILTLADKLGEGSTAGQWLYSIDAQARFIDIGSGFNQQLIRPALGFQPGKNLQFWVGYARLRNRFASDSFENRFFQQVNWTAGEFAGGTVSLRLRLLQRNVSAGDDVGIALRVLAKYVRPLAEDPRHSLVISIEPFIDFRDTDWGGDKGLNQNRTFVGINRKISAKSAVEFGYLNQYTDRNNNENLSNHLAVANLKTRF